MNSLKKSKRGVFDQLSALAIGVATLIVVFAVIFLIVAQTQTQMTDLGVENDTAYNATVTLANAAATVPGWVSLIVLVSIGGILLGLISLFRRKG